MHPQLRIAGTWPAISLSKRPGRPPRARWQVFTRRSNRTAAPAGRNLPPLPQTHQTSRRYRRLDPGLVHPAPGLCCQRRAWRRRWEIEVYAAARPALPCSSPPGARSEPSGRGAQLGSRSLTSNRIRPDLKSDLRSPRLSENAKIGPPAPASPGPSPASTALNESAPGPRGGRSGRGAGPNGDAVYDRRTLQNPAAVYVFSPLMIRYFGANVKGYVRSRRFRGLRRSGSWRAPASGGRNRGGPGVALCGQPPVIRASGRQPLFGGGGAAPRPLRTRPGSRRRTGGTPRGGPR